MLIKNLLYWLTLFAFCIPLTVNAERQPADMPKHVQKHLMTTMRDHLHALEEITQHLSQQEYEKAADTAEKHLGMSTVEIHYKKYVGKYMPKGMRNLGTKMHDAATDFAKTARNARTEGGLNQTFAALSKIMKQCVACHEAYQSH